MFTALTPTTHLLILWFGYPDLIQGYLRFPWHLTLLKILTHFLLCFVFFLPTKVCLVKAMGFPVVRYGCETWTVKKAECQKVDAFELWCWRRLKSPLDCKEIQPVHPKDQSWVFTGRTDAEAKNPILWPPHVKNWLICKDPDAGRDLGKKEKGTTEDEMAGWHHQLDGREFE